MDIVYKIWRWRLAPGCGRAVGLCVVAVAALALANCASSKDFAAGTKASPRVVELGQPVPKGGGQYKVGKPYKVAGNWYVPRDEPGYRAQGTASWYGEDFHGRYTANGEIYDMATLSAAHPTLPLPSYAEVTNLDNGRTIVVRINDRGPYAHGRVIDVSKKAAELLDFKNKGITRVEVAYVGPAPLDGADGWAVNIPPGGPTTTFASVEPAPLPPVASPRQPNPQPVYAAAPPPQGQGYVIPASYTPEPPAQPLPSGQAHALQSPDQLRPGTYILAGTFRDPANARKLGETIALNGFLVDIVPIEVSGEQMYKVRLGPLTPEGAGQAFSVVTAAGATGARIVELR